MINSQATSENRQFSTETFFLIQFYLQNHRIVTDLICWVCFFLDPICKVTRLKFVYWPWKRKSHKEREIEKNDQVTASFFVIGFDGISFYMEAIYRMSHLNRLLFSCVCVCLFDPHIIRLLLCAVIVPSKTQRKSLFVFHLTISYGALVYDICRKAMSVHF